MDDVAIQDLSPSELRKFGLTTGAIIAVLFGLLLPWIWEFGYPLWPWIVFAFLGSWGLVLPKTLQSVYRGWMRVGLAISKVTTPLILGIVFYMLIMPVGLAMRLFGWDAMNRDIDPQADTYRKTRTGSSDSSLENPY